MSDFYEKMQGIATSLLTRFNQGTIELGLVTKGTGPANNPGPSTTDWKPAKGAARAAKGSVLLEPNTLVKTGDLIVTIAIIPGIRKPVVGDEIRFGGPTGQTWRVVRVDMVPATGTMVAWKLYVRRG